MKHHFKYLRYVVRHKWFVLRAGSHTGASLWRLLKHDWSKFLPGEWFPYATYFYAPTPEVVYVDMRNVTGMSELMADVVKREREADFNVAWLKHQHRNDHHWQHWVLRNDDGTTACLQMPEAAMLEMVADWMGAGRAITGKWEALSWYEKNAHKILLHNYTKNRVVELLVSLAHQKGMA